MLLKQLFSCNSYNVCIIGMMHVVHSSSKWKILLSTTKNITTLSCWTLYIIMFFIFDWWFFTCSLQSVFVVIFGQYYYCSHIIVTINLFPLAIFLCKNRLFLKRVRIKYVRYNDLYYQLFKQFSLILLW